MFTSSRAPFNAYSHLRTSLAKALALLTQGSQAPTATTGAPYATNPATQHSGLLLQAVANTARAACLAASGGSEQGAASRRSSAGNVSGGVPGGKDVLVVDLALIQQVRFHPLVLPFFCPLSLSYFAQLSSAG